MNVLQILMFAAIVLEVIFVPIFLKNEWPNRSYRSLAYKQLCSALFLVVGLCAIFHAKNYSAYSWLVLGALVGSFIGDALLHYEAIIKNEAILFIWDDCICPVTYPLPGGICYRVQQAVSGPEPRWPGMRFSS